ncbi:mCG147750 [Mus musculus]|nr:mCG147750 [Mus musculus]
MISSVKLTKCRKHPKEGPFDMPMGTNLLGLRRKRPPFPGWSTGLCQRRGGQQHAFSPPNPHCGCSETGCFQLLLH